MSVRLEPMPAYFIFQGEVTDPERYEEYKLLAQRSIEAAGGRYVVRGGAGELCEGTLPSRTVILEFPDMDAVRAWYHGEAYSAARKLREQAAQPQHVFMVEGWTR
jgi:uncharacterized protein (DUF1330 family)